MWSAESEVDMEDLDVDEVAEWILEEGFPATVAGAFSGMIVYIKFIQQG